MLALEHTGQDQGAIHLLHTTWQDLVYFLHIFFHTTWLHLLSHKHVPLVLHLPTVKVNGQPSFCKGECASVDERRCAAPPGATMLFGALGPTITDSCYMSG